MGLEVGHFDLGDEFVLKPVPIPQGPSKHLGGRLSSLFLGEVNIVAFAPTGYLAWMAEPRVPVAVVLKHKVNVKRGGVTVGTFYGVYSHRGVYGVCACIDTCVCLYEETPLETDRRASTHAGAKFRL